MKNSFSIKYLILAAVVLNGCKEKINDGQIISISFSSSGGQLGFNSTQKITSDSLVYFCDIYVDTIAAIDERKANKSYSLNDMISDKEIETLSTVKSGESTIAFDGIDTKLVVETKSKTYVVINAEKDPLWLKMQSTFNGIFKKEFNAK